MKTSGQTKLTLVASLAAFLTSCSPDPRTIRRCVDANNRVADDWYCDDQDPRHATAAPGVYRFYYGGPAGYLPVGSLLTGGSLNAPAGVTAFTSPAAQGATSRGVLGAAGEAHGAAGGEGAGE